MRRAHFVLILLFFLCFITYGEMLGHPFMIDDFFFIGPSSPAALARHDGSIYKQEINEAAFNGPAILEGLIKRGVLKDGSTIKVYVSPHLEKKENLVRSIAQDSFAPVWRILTQAYSLQFMSPAMYYYRDVVDCFKKPFGHHYNPFYLMLNEGLFRLNGSQAFFLYLINLLLFFTDCCLVFFFIYLVSKNFIMAILTALMFCIHPMSAEIVTHITLNILLIQTLFFLFGLMSLYSYVKLNAPKSYYFFSIFMMGLSLFCHEISILFPLYAAAMLFCLTDLNPKKIMKIILPYVFLSILLMFLWRAVVNSNQYSLGINLLRKESFWQLNADFSHVIFWYLGNLFVPRNIVFMANMPFLRDSLLFWNILFFSLLLGCGLVIYYFKRSLESFAMVVFLAGLIFAFPASLVQGGMGEIFEPNWLYFSSIGVFLFFTLMLLRLAKGATLYICIIFTLILGVSFMLTLRQNSHSRTEKDYCEYWLSKFPDNILPLNELKNYYYRTKESIPANDIPYLLTLVDVELKANNPDAVDLIEMLSISHVLPADKKQLRFKLAAFYCKNGYNEICSEMFHHYIGLGNPLDLLRLSSVLYNFGADQAAMAMLKQCLVLYPRYKEPYLLMGVILANERQYSEGIKIWKKGLAIDPSDSRFINCIHHAQALMNKLPA